MREVMIDTFQEIAGRSIVDENLQIRPIYRLGLLAYSEDVWDVLGGIKGIDEFLDGHHRIPRLPLQTTTNISKAIRGVAQVIKQDIQNWSERWEQRCPAPLVIHITDAELTKEFEDPIPAAKELTSLSVPDGNILLANIFISEHIKLPDVKLSLWKGYHPEDTTDDRFGDMLIAMSSRIPEPYFHSINMWKDKNELKKKEH